jgi:hypothetical protein
MSNVTKQELIEKFIKIHGYKYDYSQVDFKYVSDKIKIICPEHGPFEQMATNHYSGANCHECSKIIKSQKLRKGFNYFLIKAKEVHGDTYDYYESEYTTTHNKTKITCKQHGDFYQTPHSHLFGQGCPQCGIIKKKIPWKKEQNINKAKEVHGDKYEYLDSSEGYFKLICKDHGEIKISTTKHLSGVGCHLCENYNDFVSLANKKHNEKFIYYKWNKQAGKINVECKEHGVFSISKKNHLKGIGCKKCNPKIVKKKVIKSKINLDYRSKVINEVKSIFGDEYDYSKYLNSNIIICKKHGEFKKRPSNHLKGEGCSKCKFEKIYNINKYNFINKCYEKHGREHDLSDINYINNKQEIIIKCPNHGMVKQNASDYLARSCKACIKFKFEENKNKKYELYINDRIKLHKEKHKGKNFEFIKNEDGKLFFECKKHGEFSCRYDTLAGCQKCIAMPDDVVISRINEVNKYKVINLYTNNKNRRKVRMLCEIHGEFEKFDFDALIGEGCKDCYYDSIRFKNEDFIERAKLKHGDTYNYSKLNYLTKKDKVEIICNQHGSFWQRPTDHWRGNGCPECAWGKRKIGISKVESDWLDSIGITIRQKVVLGKSGAKYLADGFDELTNTIYEFNGDFWHGNPNVFNQKKLNNVIGKTFEECYKATLDKEKDLIEAGYKVVTMWEDDWRKLSGKTF